MKKTIIFMIMILLLCGCNATYNIDILDDTVIENLTLLETDLSKVNIKGESGMSYTELIEYQLKDDPYSVRTYDIQKIDNEEGLGLKYNQTLSVDDIKNLGLLNQCYNDYLVQEYDNQIIIDTGYNFKCYEYYEYLDNITITLKTNHEVKSSNGKKNLDGTYTWNFSKTGRNQIKLTISKDVKETDYKGIILISIVLVLLIGYKIYLSKKEK